MVNKNNLIGFVNIGKELANGLKFIIPSSKEISISSNLLSKSHLRELGSCKILIFEDLGSKLNHKHFNPLKYLPNGIIISKSRSIQYLKDHLSKKYAACIHFDDIPSELTKAIKSIGRNERYFSTFFQNIIVSQLTSSTKLKDTEIEHNLTSRELEILKLISQEFTSDEIALQLHLAKSTIDTYRKKLIQKLKVKNSIGLALYVVKNEL